ncbi:MAG TPA: RNA methyltransferase [Polyangiales bacterium]|nr:RNA methyltransferase [Polyangiales bacterium]
MTRERERKPAHRPRAEPAERVYGLSAALALFARRPEAVLSIAHTPDARKPLAKMLSEAARRRVAYREVDDDTLAKMAESVHHEGVCLLVRPLPAVQPSEIARLAGEQGLVVALDSVDNPHNIGAILRSAAYFGVSALLIGGSEAKLGKSPVNAATRRVAEGGAELVPVARAADLAASLRQLKDLGFGVFGADARASVRVSELRWPERAVLVLGHEREGLSSDTRKACDTLVRIPGTGAVDSLNVSVAAGVLIASYVASHGLGRAP